MLLEKGFYNARRWGVTSTPFLLFSGQYGVILRAMRRDRKHHLDRVTLGELTVASFQYPAIRVLYRAFGDRFIPFISLRGSRNWPPHPICISGSGSGFTGLPSDLVFAPLVCALGTIPLPVTNNRKAMEAHPL